MTTCDDVDLILAVGAVDGGYEAEDAALLRGHLPGCARCSRAAVEYRATVDLMGLSAPAAEPSARLRSRVMGAVYGSGPAETTRPAAPPWWRRLWEAVPSGRAFTLGGGLAALAAVALLVWAVGPGRSGGGSSPSAPLSASVRGTVAEPGVQGSLTYYPQQQTAVLSVRGLRPQAGGQVYEVWLVRPDNAVTAAGYLTRQPDGSWSVAMHGDMHGYSAVAATVEPPGGSGMPTGQQVLVGSLPST